MINDDNDIKDTGTDLGLSVKDNYPSISYSKSNKLIMALFMVTDIMDKDEPLRNKIRNLGIEILSDIHSAPLQAESKIAEIVSFLDISSSIHLISEMNSSILKKEFYKLAESIKEYGKIRSTWFEDFPLDSSSVTRGTIGSKITFSKYQPHYKGHDKSSRTDQPKMNIGVQKGSTLMKALSDKASILSTNSKDTNSFDLLRKERREDILRIIKTDEKGLTITDIKTKAKDLQIQAKAVLSCGDKTLQRELFSMVKDGVLYKTGEKRWSKYFIS